MSQHYDAFCDAYGVEPECSDCSYFILGQCSLLNEGIECDGESEFTLLVPIYVETE